MASFDIVNLYTNIPIKETLQITRNNLIDNNSGLSTDAINELIDLLQITLEQNYFAFNGKYYLQDKGLAMGSPLSGILSEIYLNNFENKNIFTDKKNFASKIIFYKRYVDDTFLIYNGKSRRTQFLINNGKAKIANSTFQVHRASGQ
jgi:hypothetical protein